MKKRGTPPVKMYILLITYAVLLVMVFINKTEILGAIVKFLGYLKPFFIGIIIAYILNNPLRYLEMRIFPRIFRKVKNRSGVMERALSTGVTVVFAVALVVTIVSVLIPQLVESASLFVSNIDTYVKTLETFTNSFADKLHLDDEMWLRAQTIGAGFLDNLATNLQSSMPSILNKTKDVMTAVINGLFNTLMSVIISIYLLFHKEKLIFMLQKILCAFMPEKALKFTFDTSRYANQIFTKFLGGQITEAFILGVLCFIGTSILGIQYSLLVSVIVGITNLIPIFGPWIGTGISTFLLLMIDPVRALWFLIFIIILQQLENNLIYPKVVGSSIGLSGLWVIVAILICGGMFGVAGMFLGIPLFAVISKLLSGFIEARYELKLAAKAEAEEASKEAGSKEQISKETEAPEKESEKPEK